MRKTIFTLLAIGITLLAGAQQNPSQDTTLQQYTGKYKFPEGSVVTEVTVAIENGTLLANSAMGSTELRKTEGDVFEIVAYSGVATFKRGEDTKVNGVKIEVGDIVMDGTKSDSISLMLMGIFFK